MLQNFELCIDTKFIFGRDAQKQVGEQLQEREVSSVLIHHDSGPFLYESGLLESVKSDLISNGIEIYELGGVLPNPRLSLVYEGIKLVLEKNIGFILAIGGGSAIDSAKAIAAGAQYEGDVWDFFIGTKEIERALPIGVVLTNPATGSESGTVAMINHEKEHLKLMVSSPRIRPAIAFMNPELTYSLPRFLTACGIVDIFSHTCERYFSPDTEFGVIDRMAEGILKTLVEIGPKVLDHPNHYDYRAQLMWMGTIAHNNTVGVGRVQDWATHEIGNELSALYDTPHGATLSIIMGSWMRYTYTSNVKRFARYAHEVFDIPYSNQLEETAKKGILCTEDFFKALGMPVCFQDKKLPTDGVKEMIARMSFRGDNKTIGGLRELNAADVSKILEMAF